MKEFKVEFKDITDYKGSIIADNLEEAVQTVLKKGHYMFNNFEPVQSELSITYIEESMDLADIQADYEELNNV